jgi:type 1 fimbria pilin
MQSNATIPDTNNNGKSLPSSEPFHALPKTNYRALLEFTPPQGETPFPTVKVTILQEIGNTSKETPFTTQLLDYIGDYSTTHELDLATQSEALNNAESIAQIIEGLSKSARAAVLDALKYAEPKEENAIEK